MSEHLIPAPAIPWFILLLEILSVLAVLGFALYMYGPATVWEFLGGILRALVKIVIPTYPGPN